MTTRQRTFLYITCANQEQFTGGSQCARRNLESLRDIVGKDHVTEYIIWPTMGKRIWTEKLGRLRDVLKLLGGGLTTPDIHRILRLMRQQTFTDVFIDSSALGVLARIIRRRHPDVSISVFFHNVEYDYMRSTILRSHDYKHLFWIASARYNEQHACKNADRIISLNQADQERIQQLYHRSSVAIPITMRDDYHDLDPAETRSPSAIPQALFVGSYFPGNVQGLKMFCQDILPHLDIHLTIVGSGMEQLRNDLTLTSQITLLGKVPDLQPCYEAADLVVLPIISGGGMKVKTAEALKYGKYIIGTPEALEGYEVSPETAAICRTLADYRQALAHFMERHPFRYHPHARQTFTQHYSYDVSLNLFRTCLQP